MTINYLAEGNLEILFLDLKLHHSNDNNDNLRQVCESLLAHKAFVNARSVTGLTALHMAAMAGFTELVKDLIGKHQAQKDSLSLVGLN